MFSIKNHEVINDPSGKFPTYEAALKALIKEEEERLSKLKAELNKPKPASAVDIIIACM